MGKPLQLKVMGIYKNSIIHDLSKEVIWKSENENVVYIDKEGMVIPVNFGQAKIRALWLDTISFTADCIVVQKMSDQDVEWLSAAVSKVSH